MKKTSVFRSLILSATLATLVILVLLLLIMYQGTLRPFERLAENEALSLAQKEVDLRLDAKRDAVISIATSLARDPRVIAGLQSNSHPQAMEALLTLREDFATSTDYRSVFAQVINREQIILARSWEMGYTGGKAPHPMVAETLRSGKASASFSIGNAGAGIIGFAPVRVDGQIIGIISVTQGLGSVVRSLKAEGMDWTLLLSIDTILKYFYGHLPASYTRSPAFDDHFLLAHDQWFDLEAANWVKQHRQTVAADQKQIIRVADEVIFDMPIYDSTGQWIGRSLLVMNAEALNTRINQGLASLVYLLFSVILVVALIATLLLWLVGRRIIRPMAQLVTTLNQAVDSGQFAARLPIQRNDELGQLTESFNRLFSCLEQGIREANSVIADLAQGDYASRMQGRYVGDLSRLQQGIHAAAGELRNTHEQLLQASKAKGEFLANMSHEIRTPLNGVIGMLSLLEHSPLNKDQAEQLQLAHHSAELLLELVNGILDFSKIEAGKMTLEQVPFNLQELLHNLELLFSTRYDPAHLTFTLQLDEAVSRWIIGDPLRLRQVLNNLLANAFKFTHQGHVHLSVKAQGDWLLIAVQDTGIGMDQATQQKLFQSFTQADSSTSRRYGGTGLGLKISKELVELMGGELQLHSSPGEGSEFLIRLPYQPSQALQPVSQAEQPLASYAGKRLLLVEDHPVNQLLAIKLLEKFGIAPDLAENGQQALEKASSNHYDLILMDCQMPVMDGYTATQRLRQQGYQGAITALTANATEQDQQQCLQAGMNDFLAKPYRLQDLAQLLQRWLAAE